MRPPGHYIEFELRPSSWGWVVFCTRQMTREESKTRNGAFIQESFMFSTKRAAIKFIKPIYRGVRPK